MISYLKELVSIPSYKGEERDIAEYLAEKIRTFGTSHKVVVQSYSKTGRNVLVLAKRPKLLLDAHLDTVPLTKGWEHDPLTLQQKGSRLSGLGVTDNKAALAICLTLLEKGVAEDLSFAFCGAEETNGAGLLYALDKKVLKAPRALVFEPTNEAVATAHKGVGTIQVKLQGIASHAANPLAGDNAIYAAIRYLNTLEKAFLPFAQSHATLGKNTYNVGQIRGGSSPNTVPRECELVIDIRILPGQSEEAVMAFFEKVLTAAQVQGKVSTSGLFPAFEYQGEPGIAQKLAKLAGTSLATVSFWTHAGIYSKAGMPALVYGPGDISVAHQPGENLSRQSLERVLSTLTKWIKQL